MTVVHLISFSGFVDIHLNGKLLNVFTFADVVKKEKDEEKKEVRRFGFNIRNERAHNILKT